MFGAVGWGAFSLAAGALVAAKGVHFGFLAYAATAAIALIPTLLLPLDALKEVSSAAGREEGDEEALPIRTRTTTRRRNTSSTTISTNSIERSSTVGTAQGKAAAHSSLSESNGGGGDSKKENGERTITSATSTTTSSSSSSSSFVDLLSNKKTSVFLGLALTLGFANGAIASFLPLYLSDLGGSESLLGAAIAVA